MVLTAIVFYPMLQNSFTNWDDLFYVTENGLLRGPDWKGIWTKPVVSNYHPLTIASLAWNYQSSALEPASYYFVNWILHAVNTLWVFLLAFFLSNRNSNIAWIVALFFGIHPMHLESVAWISERKDVLYTFFFLPSLICYWKYLDSYKKHFYIAALLLFIASLLSKPAAIILPFLLLLIDYYRNRGWSKKIWMEKIPFFLFMMIFLYLTLQIQSEKAIAKADSYSMMERILFAFYGFVEYVRRFFWPFPLSSFHPFPKSGGALPVMYYLAPILALIIAGITYYFRKQKWFIFSMGFFFINIMMILQFPITFGNCIIAERYTYVAYIGFAFGLAMAWQNFKQNPIIHKILTGCILLLGGVFLYTTFQRVGVWKNTETLWNSVIEVYPQSYISRANRANYLTQENRLEEALKDCNVALEVKPSHGQSLDNRAGLYIRMGKPELAVKDAASLIRYQPESFKGYLLMGYAQGALQQVDSALAMYTKAIELNPKSHEALGNRATILFNQKKQFDQALTDFNQAIELQNTNTMYLLNRAKCYYMMGQPQKALEGIQEVERLGGTVAESFKANVQTMLNMKK